MRFSCSLQAIIVSLVAELASLTGDRAQRDHAKHRALFFAALREPATTTAPSSRGSSPSRDSKSPKEASEPRGRQSPLSTYGEGQQHSLSTSKAERRLQTLASFKAWSDDEPVASSASQTSLGDMPWTDERIAQRQQEPFDSKATDAASQEHGAIVSHQETLKRSGNATAASFETDAAGRGPQRQRSLLSREATAASGSPRSRQHSFVGRSSSIKSSSDSSSLPSWQTAESLDPATLQRNTALPDSTASVVFSPVPRHAPKRSPLRARLSAAAKPANSAARCGSHDPVLLAHGTRTRAVAPASRMMRTAAAQQAWPSDQSTAKTLAKRVLEETALHSISLMRALQGRALHGRRWSRERAGGGEHSLQRSAHSCIEQALQVPLLTALLSAAIEVCAARASSRLYWIPNASSWPFLLRSMIFQCSCYLNGFFSP